MVWILQWCCDSDINCSLWNSQADALTQACSEIQEDIMSNWDLDEEFIHEAAKSITDCINAGALDVAVEKWNDFQCEFHDDCPQTYLVAEYEIETRKPALKTLILSDFESDEEEEEEEDDSVIMEVSGATCRGPCKQYNEYAYPDRLDGTYHCSQCKTFQGMFKP